jgi:hypothetical protein
MEVSLEEVLGVLSRVEIYEDATEDEELCGVKTNINDSNFVSESEIL